MDAQEKKRFVRQYVERQRAYVPTYTAQTLDERPRTPSKQNDEFGFDTPVLRPRVDLSRSRAQSSPSHAPRGGVDTREKENKKATTPIADTDNERAARLADRRERKRKKRAIVEPQKDHVGSKKGRTDGEKAKKPAGLALLYGFSATNVTKDRLTLKPAPTIGVFSRGKASEKKKVTVTKKRCRSPAITTKDVVLNDAASRNGVFSESAFLGKGSEHVADHSKTNDDSSISSVSVPKNTKGKRKNREKSIETPTKTTRAESEVWEIELQSKLPSTVHDILSEPKGKESPPVILDLRGARWSASVNECHKAGTPSLPWRSSPVAGSKLRHEHCLAPAADASSIHPSHSASQAGCRAAVTRSLDERLEHFAGENPVMSVVVVDQDLGSKATEMANSLVSVALPVVQFPNPYPCDMDRDAGQAAMANSLVSVAQPVVQFPNPYPCDMDRDAGQAAMANSLISAVQPMVQFPIPYPYDVVPLEFSSDVSPGDECWARPWEPLENFESSFAENRLTEYQHWTGLGNEYVGVENPLVVEYEDEVEYGSVEGPTEPGQYVELEVEHGDIGSENGDDFARGVSGLARAEMEVASRLRGHWRPIRY